MPTEMAGSHCVLGTGFAAITRCTDFFERQFFSSEFAEAKDNVVQLHREVPPPKRQFHEGNRRALSVRTCFICKSQSSTSPVNRFAALGGDLAFLPAQNHIEFLIEFTNEL
jgi:hypothetical protein